MALILQSTGIATNLDFCVAVDDDGTTIKEFVSSDVNANKTVDGAVTVGASTWKGTSRAYFQTLANGSFDFYGVRFALSHQATTSDLDTDGIAIFMAFAGASAGSGVQLALKATGLSYGFGASRKPCIYTSAFTGSGGTTGAPSDGTTKFSIGINHQNSSGDAYYYGLESGSLAADGSSTNSASFGSASDSAQYIGGWPSQGNAPGKFHIACRFNRQLTLTEMQSLHNDWFNTLFTTSGGSNPPPTFPGPSIANENYAANAAITPIDVSGSFSDTDTLTYSAVGTWPTGITVSSVGVISGTPTVAGTYASLQVKATDTASQTVNSNTFTITVTTAGTITTSPLKNNTGTLLASQTGATAYVYTPSTGALVVKLTSQTTNSSGVMTFSDVSIVTGTSYRVVVALASGAEGMATITAT